MRSSRVLLGRLRGAHLALDRHQRAVPAVDARPDPPAVERRHDPRRRHDHDQQRQHHDQQAIDQARQPERQPLVEELLARLVVALGVLADREVARQRRREFARVAEHARGAVNLARRADQQVRQRRVQVVARDQLHRRADQRQRARRVVLREIHRALRAASASTGSGTCAGSRRPAGSWPAGCRARRAGCASPAASPNRPSGTRRRSSRRSAPWLLPRPLRSSSTVGGPSISLAFSSFSASTRVPLPSGPIARRLPLSCDSSSTGSSLRQ